MTASTTCVRCGAQNLGTRFCENCGEPAAVAPATAHTPVALMPAGPPPQPPTVGATSNLPPHIPGAPAKGRTRVFVVAQCLMAIGFVLASSFPAIVSLISSELGIWWEAYPIIRSVAHASVFVWVVVAAVASRAAVGARIGAIALSLLYSLTGLVYLWQPHYMIATVIGHLALFVAWALLRGFRGRGWLGILVMLGFVAVTAYSSGEYFYAVTWELYRNFWGALLVELLIGALALAQVAVVAFASIRFERASAARRATLPAVSPLASFAYAPATAEQPSVYAAAPGYPQRTNTIAVLAFVFAFLLPAVFPVIFGHVALGQIKRTGEGGRGFAIAALVLGYIGVAVVTLLVINAIVAFSAASSYLYY